MESTSTSSRSTASAKLLEGLAVGAGGILGSFARFGLMGPGSAWGLLAVNAAGAFLLAWLRWRCPWRARWWLAGMGSGFCGGLTTVSGLSLMVADWPADDRLGRGALMLGHLAIVPALLFAFAVPRSAPTSAAR